MLALMIAILLAQVIIIAGGYYVIRKISAIICKSTALLQSIFLPPMDGESSAFGQAVDQITDSISQKIGVTTQAALRGSLGGTMKAVNAELEREAVSQDPAAAALQALPKSLKKNPVAMIGLQSIMSKFLQGNTSGSGGIFNSGNNGNQAKFNL